MEEKSLLDTLRYLNYKHEKRDKVTVKNECSRIFGLINSKGLDFKIGLRKYVYSSNGKKRYVAKYHSAFDEGYSVQRNLAHQITRALRIEYSNRNLLIHELFGVLKALELMMNFTIIRFDFKGFFYSIKPIYIWNKYLKDSLPAYVDLSLIESYCKQMDIAYPGLEMSNVLAEVAAIEFDRRIKSYLSKYGILFYSRFVDDGLIILKEDVTADTINPLMQRALRDTFANDDFSVKCTTRFHRDPSSAKYFVKNLRDITANTLDFSFLGYRFWISFRSDKLQVLFGIDTSKLSKFKNKLTRVLSKVTDSDRCFLIIRLQVARVVYSVKENGIDIWKERGFSSTYKELGSIDESHIHPSTKSGLKNLILDALRDSGKVVLLSRPRLEAVKKGKKYNLYKSILKGTTIIFDYRSRVGCSWRSMLRYVKTMKKSLSKTDYQSLTKELLISTKVGY